MAPLFLVRPVVSVVVRWFVGEQPRLVERRTHLAVRIETQALKGERGPQAVAAEAFQTLAIRCLDSAGRVEGEAVHLRTKRLAGFEYGCLHAGQQPRSRQVDRVRIGGQDKRVLVGVPGRLLRPSRIPARRPRSRCQANSVR